MIGESYAYSTDGKEVTIKLKAGLKWNDGQPLTADDAICHVPGIVLTPHVGWRADGAFKELTRQMIACLTAYFAGEDYNVVVSER